jgi:hypothetical protein
MTCPESEVLAAHSEGRLDPAESAVLLEHAADCDGCRRELALLETGRIPDAPETALPLRIRAKVIQGPSRPYRPLRPLYRPRPSYAGLVAAAAVAIAIVAAAALGPRPDPEAPHRAAPAPVEAPVAVAPTPAPVVPRPAPVTVAVPVPEPEAPAPGPDVAPPAEPPRAPEPVPPVPAVPPPAPRETKAEEPVPSPAPTHVAAARSLTELQATDFSGPVVIRRKAGGAKERPTGVARLSEGDVLVAEKVAGFHVDGVHPVVLGEKAELSIAFAADDRAPWLHVRSGEIVVDSLRPTRWVVTDGRVAVTLRQARARFSALPGRGLVIGALSEPVYVQPDGGAVHAVRPGEELEVGKASADLRPADAAGAERRRLAFDAARPRQRTVFFSSCDPVDAKREHYFVEEGSFFKNESLLSKDHADRTTSVVLATNPRLTWREGLSLRFRFRTNAQSLQVSFPVADKRFSLTSTVAVDRKNVNQWVTAEVPFNSLYWRDEQSGLGGPGLGFGPGREPGRDPGLLMRFVSTGDKFESMKFAARQQDVFGDQKVTFLLDDVQIVASSDRER